MRFDLADLRLFVAVTNAGSITHGAAAANLSLAAASERLRDMELVSAVQLLVRSRRGVVPTRAGDALARHARLVLRQVGAMQAELSDHAHGFRGSVRLLANSAAASCLLPDRLGSFLVDNPRADIDLSERPSADIAKAIAGGLGDIGIASDAADTGSLCRYPFAVDQLVVVMRPDHPLSANRRLNFAQVAAEPMVGYDGALQLFLEEQAARIGLRARPRIRLQTFEGICRMACDGAGIGIVPEVAARQARRLMPLTFVRLSDAWAARRLILCTRSEDQLEPLARALLNHLADKSENKSST